MSMHQEATDALREVKAKLASAPQGGLDLEWVETNLPPALKLLAREEPQWIGTAEAQRLLGIDWESSVPYWMELGLLRGRPGPNNSVEVRLDDVLRERLVRESLLAIGGDEMTPEALRVLTEMRPGTNPWDRDGGSQ